MIALAERGTPRRVIVVPGWVRPASPIVGQLSWGHRAGLDVRFMTMEHISAILGANRDSEL